MAYSKTFRALVPVSKADLQADPGLADVTLWLTRESFDRAASSDGLVIVSFTELDNLDPADVPPKAEKQIGVAATEFAWRRFEGVGQRPKAGD